MKTPETTYGTRELEAIAACIRGRLVEMSNHSRAAHLGSALSCVDLLVAAYWKILNINEINAGSDTRDRFVLSKGHAAASLYAVLAFKKIISKDRLDTYCLPGSLLEDHPGPGRIPGVEAATGSLGHGLSLGTGMAMADRLKNRDRKTFVLLSDGECNEGSVWEAAMFASGQHLGNLNAVLDFNKWQATGRSCEISGIQPLVEKWRAFGWKTFEIDGHKMDEAVTALGQAYDCRDTPCAVIAHTVKGKGVSFMEDDNNWHYRIPTLDEVAAARKELGLV